MLTSTESILSAISQLSGVELAVVGEATEALLVAGNGHEDTLRRLVRHQSHIFRQRAEMLEDMGMQEGLVETLVTLNEHYHIARFFVSEGMEGVFLYVVLNRQQANLGMARIKLAEIAQKGQLSPAERNHLLNAARADEAGYYPIGDLPASAPAVETTPKVQEGRLRRLLHLSRRTT